MIHPSYVELMKVVNDNVDVGEEPVVNSRYSIVSATAKRARQIVGGSDPLCRYQEGEKPLSVAVRELYERELLILTDEEAADRKAKVDEAKRILGEREAKRRALEEEEAAKQAEAMAAKAAMEAEDEEFDEEDSEEEFEYDESESDGE